MDPTQLAKLQIITTIVVTAANVFLVVLTSAYVYLTRQMVNEMRATRDPSVFVDLELPGHNARLAIGNAGQTSALNIKFTVDDDIPWRGGRRTEGLTALAVIQNGVSYLPPGRTLKYSTGAPDWDKIDPNHVLKIGVRYENETGKHFKREYFIDLSHYKEILFESFRDSNMAIADAIRDVEQSRHTRERGDRLLSDMGATRLSEKRCTMCAEVIPRQAKKCSHCGEIQSNEAA